MGHQIDRDAVRQKMAQTALGGTRGASIGADNNLPPLMMAAVKEKEKANLSKTILKLQLNNLGGKNTHVTSYQASVAESNRI